MPPAEPASIRPPSPAPSAFRIGLICLVLGAQFKSYFQPLMILATVPMAFTGVDLGLLITGDPLSLYTMYGVVALLGIAVNVAIRVDLCRQ